MNKKRKIPFRAIEGISTAKNPRISSKQLDDGLPEFRAGKMDMGGKWGWHQPNSHTIDMKEFLDKIFENQKLSWQEIRNNKSHEVELDQIIPEARKRLEEIEQDEIATLYSLRLTGRMRIWGIKDNNIFWILWWDPHHEVCPSLKKHT